MSERNHIFGKVDKLKVRRKEPETVEVGWQVHYEVQIEYYNHLVYLLEPPLVKLLDNLAVKIQALYGEYVLKVKVELLGAEEKIDQIEGQQQTLDNMRPEGSQSKEVV